MILSEQDASTKRCQESFGDQNYCPFGLSYPSPASPVPVYAAAYVAQTTSPSQCIGSACMAWRWLGWRDQNGAVYANSTNRSGVEHVGYCGKAGTP